jgi:hypothetical protein
MPVRTRRNSPSRRCPASPALGLVESFEKRILFAVDVTLGTGSPSSTLVFTDGDGTNAQIRVSGGTATITFDGNPVSQSTSGRLTTVTGTGVAMTNLVMGGASPNVSIRTTGGTNGTVTLAAMTSNPPVRAFSGRGVVLTGPATFDNGVGKLELASAQDATITINRGSQALLQDASVTILDVDDSTITSQQPLRQLRVGEWEAGIPGQPDAVTAPRINVLQCARGFNADVTLSGNGQVVGRPVLGSVKVLGGLESGTWNVAGKTSRIATGGVDSGWTGTFGDVANFTVTGNMAGSITANSINAMNVGTLTNANIDLTRPFAANATALNRLNVRSAISGTRIRSDANIGTVSAESISGSSIFAGVANGGGGGAARALPTDATSFVNPASIKSVTVRSRGTPSFVGSNIVASSLGRLNLGTVQTNNGGTPYGVAANDIASIQGQRSDTGETARAARLTDPSDNIVAGDFNARLF